MKRENSPAAAPLMDAISSADRGDFRDAVRQSNGYDHLLPTELYGLLAKRNANQSLGSWLAKQATIAGTNRIFSTWDFLKAADWLAVKNAAGQPMLTVDGNGTVRESDSLEFVTLGDQTARLRMAGLSPTGVYVIHMLASFPSNVGDNFYLQLNGPGTSEAVRFSNTSVSLVNHGAVSKIVGSAPKLYTLEVAPQRTRLYVNGVLYNSKINQNWSGSNELTIKLIGEHGPDLAGTVHGFEVQHANQLSGPVFGDDQSLFLSRLQELLAQRNANDIYHLLKGIDDPWVQSVDDELLSLMDGQAHNRGVQEWVYDEVLSRVSAGAAAEWINSHRNLLPAPVLSVNHLTSEFMLSPNNRFALGSVLRRKGRERFLVLNDISFDVFPGDIVGIIGPNGAGKSTLLRAISGLMPIQKGEITVRVEHLLLSAGIGARNELTGRENIYLAGTFMGLSKSQIDGLFDEIWEFSELGPAIDKPFKYYSDGMKGRLVFSLATSVSPQILMLDELLSAGDIKFQKKAGDRMEKMLDRAKAVIIVTHSVQFVTQRCNKALLIADGRLAAYGDPEEVVAKYLNLLHLGAVPSDADINPLDMAIQQQVIGGFANG